MAASAKLMTLPRIETVLSELLNLSQIASRAAAPEATDAERVYVRMRVHLACSCYTCTFTHTRAALARAHVLVLVRQAHAI